MLELKRRGAIVFDYGNNLRALAVESGVANAFDYSGFVPEFIRPMFCEGNGPFRWVALSGDPNDIAVTDRTMLELFPQNQTVQNWIKHGAPTIAFQGLPARICWLRHGERERRDSRSMTSSNRARSRPRSSSDAIISIADRSLRPIVRPKPCATAPTP